MLKFHIILFIVSISIVASVGHAYAKVQKIDPEILNYHLELAQGILETCYARDSDTDNLVPNPALPVLSDLGSTCEKKMRSLDSFLAKFVGDRDGKIYAEHIGNNSES